MFQRKAFLHWYTGEGMEEDEFSKAEGNNLEWCSKSYSCTFFFAEVNKILFGFGSEKIMFASVSWFVFELLSLHPLKTRRSWYFILKENAGKKKMSMLFDYF